MPDKKVTKASEKQRILEVMSITDPASDEYKRMEKRLNELDANKHKWNWSSIIEASIKTVGTLAGITAIAILEKKGMAFVSQGSKFLRF